jgi:hypothetical protein
MSSSMIVYADGNGKMRLHVRVAIVHHVYLPTIIIRRGRGPGYYERASTIRVDTRIHIGVEPVVAGKPN